MNINTSINLKNQNLNNVCLFASPYLTCPYFGKSVVYIFSHSKNSTLGFTLNKPLNSNEILKLKQNTVLKALPNNVPIYLGGPVNQNAITVIHSSEYKTEGTLNKGGSLSLTENTKIIEDIATNQGPKYYLIVKGCSTWVAGQLENEIKEDSWIVSEFSSSYITENHKEVWYKFYNKHSLPYSTSSFVSNNNKPS